MAYSNGGKSRFGFRFMSHETPNHLRTDESSPWTNSSILTKSEENRGHVGKPPVEEKSPFLVEETIYVVRPASPYSQSHGPIERISGSTEGSFQRSEPVYGVSEVTSDRWARPSLNPTGGKFRPVSALEKVTIDGDSVMEFLLASVGPARAQGRREFSSWSEGNRVSGTIDSREAAKKYGGYQV